MLDLENFIIKFIGKEKTAAIVKNLNKEDQDVELASPKKPPYFQKYRIDT